MWVRGIRGCRLPAVSGSHTLALSHLVGLSLHPVSEAQAATTLTMKNAGASMNSGITLVVSVVLSYTFLLFALSNNPVRRVLLFTLYK